MLADAACDVDDMHVLQTASALTSTHDLLVTMS